ncbi:unnamed protein product [Gongylonema pulchrum]|uniref:Secreted protein n=1 Tax=Gongylonema pulchrum TaxID=637853 RepID=A0A183DLN5_9BILA|nr:unnamed protein product [Gongylonema pulchrum]
MLPKRLSIFLLFASLTIAKKRHVSDFEFFTFAQMFPAAVCQVDNMDDPATCKIPTGASPWTVHGLW